MSSATAVTSVAATHNTSTSPASSFQRLLVKCGIQHSRSADEIEGLAKTGHYVEAIVVDSSKDFGVFVALSPEWQAVMFRKSFGMSEFTSQDFRDKEPSAFAVGDRIRVRVVSFDKKSERIQVAMKKNEVKWVPPPPQWWREKERQKKLMEKEATKNKGGGGPGGGGGKAKK